LFVEAIVGTSTGDGVDPSVSPAESDRLRRLMP